MRKRRTIAIAALAILVTAWAVCYAFPRASKARVIRTLSWSGSYQTYDRLADMLRIGMTADEVRAVLGAPESVYELPAGLRWLYDEVEATTGWLCIADFAPVHGVHRLQYFCNVEHIVFPTSRHREFGSPIDDGEFKGVSLLRARRNEWQKARRPNKSVEANRRPASPFEAGREFGHAPFASSSPSAAVAHLCP